MVETGSPSTGVASLPRRIVGVVARKRTYANLLYLLLAFPLGFLYGWLLSFGFLVGLFTTIIGIGFVILALTVGGTRVIARFERWLANTLLGTNISPPADRPAADGIWATVRSYVDAPSTWRGFGFVFLKFMVGVVGFLLALALVNAVQFILAPLRYPTTVEFGEVNGEPVVWEVATQTEALALLPVGLVLLLFVFHLVNGVAYATARMADGLLGDVSSASDDADPSPVAVQPDDRNTEAEGAADRFEGDEDRSPPVDTDTEDPDAADDFVWGPR
ncbi:sensor domain-containing protein [Halorubrum vacuolatum]|uniref:Putative sensor n=1 Tax=Halorubrum vacuolatum TaxID=63740 RepID=A0A238W3K5_HALVU|nr:sensor domain-containing protein [Halorubrum vacuolatum]SNR40987.1 Putative sensor [Halorubrum vacuolatum]